MLKNPIPLNASSKRSQIAPPELRCYFVTEQQWESASRMESFLQLAACITEKQSGSLYITLSFTALA